MTSAALQYEKLMQSKLAINQAILEKNKELPDGSVVYIKRFSTAFGTREVPHILSTCSVCNQKFLQRPRKEGLWKTCEECCRMRKNKL